MHKLNLRGLTILGALLMLSCSDKDEVTGPVDATAPSAITDLSAGNPTGSSITLSWTAPGDDGDIGEARQYEIRYATSAITEDNWSDATSVTNPPEPTVGGAGETFEVTGLSPTTEYYFAIRTGDEVPNWSELSNNASATTLLAGNWNIYSVGTGYLPSDTINTIVFRPGGSRFFGTEAGLVAYTGANWLVFDTTFSDIVSDHISALAIDSSSILWIGTRNDGLSTYDGADFVTYADTNSDLTSNAVRAVTVNAAGDVWIGTVGGGIFRVQGTTWTNLTTTDGLHSNAISALAVDADDNLWIGHNFGGVDRYDGVDFEYFDNSDGFTSNGVTSILAADGDIWFGTEEGAFVYSDDAWQVYNVDNSDLASNFVLSIAVDLSGHRWFATPAGLSRFDGAAWTTYTSANSFLPDNRVRALRVDEVGALWIGTEGGIGVFND